MVANVPRVRAATGSEAPRANGGVCRQTPQERNAVRLTPHGGGIAAVLIQGQALSTTRAIHERTTAAAATDTRTGGAVPIDEADLAFATALAEGVRAAAVDV